MPNLVFKGIGGMTGPSGPLTVWAKTSVRLAFGIVALPPNFPPYPPNFNVDRNAWQDLKEFQCVDRNV